MRLIKQELNVTKPEIMIINPGEELIIKIKEIKIKINAMDANHCPGALLLLFEFLNGLLDYPIMHTLSDKPLLRKWLHPRNISAEITFFTWV